MKYVEYAAVANMESAARAGSTSPFRIDVRFLGGLSDSQMDAFRTAADRWTRIIVGDLPAVEVDREVIDDLLILAEGAKIDGPGKVLGQAGPTKLRPASAGAAAFLPVKGVMKFDTDDLVDMERNGTLTDVITHEMGHVLGIGTVWDRKRLLRGAGTTNPQFIGAAAVSEYIALRGGGATGVPLENRGGPGTADSHWRETVFFNELMSGYIAAMGNPISRMTVGSLADLGYQVDFSAAEEYRLPDLVSVMESAALESNDHAYADGIVLPNIPTVLPDESLVEM